MDFSSDCHTIIRLFVRIIVIVHESDFSSIYITIVHMLDFSSIYIVIIVASVGLFIIIYSTSPHTVFAGIH